MNETEKIGILKKFCDGLFEDGHYRSLDDFSILKCVWLDDPTKYEYVREGSYQCCSPNYKPIHRKETTILSIDNGKDIKKTPMKLIGYTKPVKTGTGMRIYSGLFWYLKGYDRGMPDAQYCYGKYPAGHPYRPFEWVTFQERKTDGLPTFRVRPREDFPEGWEFDCPRCGQIHRHGRMASKKEHRGSHCTNMSDYYIEQPSPEGDPEDEPAETAVLTPESSQNNGNGSEKKGNEVF